MNNVQNSSPANRWFRQLPGRILQLFTHNWAWKLLSLFLALCLWAGLITQDASLTREKTFSDVVVSASGADTLRRENSLIVVGGLEQDNLTVRLKADVPQMRYSSALASSYSPRIDLSRISGTGEQTLKVTTGSSTLYGSVTSVVPETITVNVDEYVTNYRVPVSANILNEMPEGFWGGNISLDPTMIAVSGPKSLVDRITRVCVDYDLSLLAPQSGTVRSACPLYFVDNSGNKVESDLLEASSAGILLRTVTVSQTLYIKQTLPVSTLNLTTGTPADGWRVKSVTVLPEEITAAGTEEGLGALEAIFTNALNIEGISENTSGTVVLRRGSEISYVSTDTVTVYVEVEPVIITRLFDALKISIRGAVTGLKATLSPKTASVMLTGPQSLTASLKNAGLSLWVDISQLTEPGDYELPLKLTVDGVDLSETKTVLVPETVTVTLK